MRLTSLGIAHPMARNALDSGFHWVTTPDVPDGCEVAWPEGAKKVFLAWTREGLSGSTSTNAALSLWLMATGALLWHPVPSLEARPEFTVQPTPDMASINWETAALHLGRQTDAYKLLLTRVKGDRVLLVRRYYQLCGDVLR